MRSLLAAGWLLVSPLVGQGQDGRIGLRAIPLPSVAVKGGPFEAPEEMQEHVRKVTQVHLGMKAKVEALLRSTFASVENGGLGMVYDNSRTRTVAEIWKERRANCLGLTAFLVSSCRLVGLDASFAEAPGISEWRKVGGFIRHEKHMVAILDNRPLGVLVMDFAPELRKNFYNVVPLGEDRALAMYHSNRAVEFLEAGRIEEAGREARAGIDASPLVGVAWNVHGVVLREARDLKGAEEAFRKALKVDPSEGAACGNLEGLCASQGRFAEAETFRAMAVQLRAKDPYFHAFLAREAMDQGDLKLARRELNQALKLFQREPEFYVLKAALEYQVGDQADAERALEQAKKWAGPAEQARMEGKLARIRRPQS